MAPKSYAYFFTADLMLVTDKAFSSVRDQTFDHRQKTVSYYLDQDVRFDIKACYLGRPSNEVIHKMIRLVSLTANASAPTELSFKQKSELIIHLKVIKLGQRNKTITLQIHRADSEISRTLKTILFQRKKK